jgi:hypothetical protein
MRHDPSVEKGPTIGDWLRATRQQRTFGPGILLSALRYMLPGHHPSTEAPTSLGLDYLDHSQIIRDLLAA